jgi:glycosyltransferase involved in cell wall biosynthesis
MKTKNKNLISCIVLSCNSNIGKGNSVFHCLCSIFNQAYDDVAEIILVENSYKKNVNVDKIKNKIDQWNKKRKIPFKFKIINNTLSLGRGMARNVGAEEASGNIFIFIDDDTIILDKTAFLKIYKLSQKFDYGYGSKRLWTIKSSFQKHSSIILKRMEVDDFNLLRKTSSKLKELPCREEAKNKDLLTRTFIGNFGFCSKNAFNKSGGFLNLKHYGFEDDYLMFQLFKNNYKFVLMDDISVVHINHEVKNEGTRNLIDYFLKLTEDNYYWFHAGETFSNKNTGRNKILEKLEALHYDYRIEKSYIDYLKSFPLNLSALDKFKMDYWKKYYLFSKIDFVRLVFLLQSSKSINDFVEKSSADFDNLAPIIKASIENNIISININGKIKKLFNFYFTRPYHLYTLRHKKFINPNKKLNQFPCDSRSVDKRYEFLKSRYPFAEYLRFAIIGDDDLLSLKFVNDYWAFPIILEKDKRIINIIKDVKNHFKIIDTDIKFIDKEEKLPLIQTFITDPPYTLNGAMAFIYTGLKMLDNNLNEKEFYVVLNPTILGKNIFILQNILFKSNIYLKEIVKNFSQYELPHKYKERTRANKFLQTHKVKSQSLSYSSSSDLYIFTTIKPNLKIIKNKIDFNKLYNHYL